MADISPATRAIVAAFDARYELCGPFDDNWQELCLAAALRALADQVVPRESMKDPLWVSNAYRQRADTRAYLLAITTELENR